MGILDDAIREHLDLKRRHGADPAEVDRQEREALGPVRRGPAEVEPLGGGRDAAADLDVYDDTGPRGSSGGLEHVGDDGAEGADPASLGQEHERDDWESGRAQEPARGDAPTHLTDSAPRRLRPWQQRRRARERQLPPDAPETAEFDVEGALASESAERNEDVLEETPEFLQDAPDHDKLWFEQRPPRDFDFDG